MKLPSCLLTLVLGVSSLTAAEFYVAPEGADTNSGTREQPFSTLAKARDAIAELRAGQSSEPVTVWMAAGNYVAREGTVFSAKDSGSASAPVIIRALPGARPTLSAGVEVQPSLLQPVTDSAILARLHPEARSHVVQLDLSAAGIQATPFKDNFRKLQLLGLYFDGRQLPLSRWPNGNTYSTIEKVTDNGLNPPHGGTFVYRGDEPARWTQAAEDEGVWLRGFWRVPWLIEAAKVARIDTAGKTITFGSIIGGGIGSKYARDKAGIGAGDGKEPWYALNLMEEIDQPGEWCVNFKTNKLYLWPPGEITKGSLFIADRTSPVVALNNASNITFRDLTIDRGLGCGFSISRSDHVVLAGCTVRDVGDVGVLIKGGHDNEVLSCTISETGQEGISLTGGERKTLTPGNHKIINNEIHDIGLSFPAAAILAGDKTKSETVGNLVAHNRIHDVPNSGIVFAGNDNVFEYNEIYRVGLGSSDLGCFYTTGGWTARGNIVRNNFVHHSMNANAFYVDDGDSGNTFTGNVAYMTASGGFVGGGHDQTFANNVLIECTRAFHVDSRGVSRHYDEHDPRLSDDLNSVPYKTPPWSEKYPQLVHILENEPQLPSGIVIRDNLIVSCQLAIRKSGQPAELAGITYENNVETADRSIFLDPDNFNFTLKPTADVLSQIKELASISFDNVGLYRDEYRASIPERDMSLLRTANTERHFDSLTDVNASNR